MIDILYLIYPTMIGWMSSLSGVRVGEPPFYENAMDRDGCLPPVGPAQELEDIEDWIDSLKGGSSKVYMSVVSVEPDSVPRWAADLTWREAIEKLVDHSKKVVILGQSRENFIYDGIATGRDGRDMHRIFSAADSVMSTVPDNKCCRIGVNRLSTKKGIEILHRYLGVLLLMQNPIPRRDPSILSKVHDSIHNRVEIVVPAKYEASEGHIVRREMFNSLKGGKIGFVAVYFNACGYKRPLNNFKSFIQRFEPIQDDLLIVELAYGDREFELTGIAKNTLQLRSNTILWQKEAMINAGTRVLRERGYENVGWMDGDTVIDGSIPRWRDKAAERLGSYNLVQCFDTITQHFDNISIKARGALAEHVNDNDDPWSCYACGGSWAVRGEIFDKCDWYDYGIAGSGDRLMFIGSLDHVHNLSKHAEMCGKDKTHLNFYKKWVKKWRGLINGSLDYLEGINFASEAHGKTTTRNYRSRAEELIEKGYVPEHVERDINGVFRWSKKAPRRLRDYLKQYFEIRKEDG